MRNVSSRGRLCALLAVVLVLLTFLPAASVEGTETCNTYYNTGIEQHDGYGRVCGGASTSACTECYKWSSPSSIESCVSVGTKSCFKPFTRDV